MNETTDKLLADFHKLCPFPKLLEGTLDTPMLRIGDRHHGKPYEMYRIARWINRIVIKGAAVKVAGITVCQPLVEATPSTPLDEIIGVIGGITIDPYDEHGNVLIKNLESKRYLKAFAGRIPLVTIDDIALWVHYHPPRETVA
jgi:hypothetical protein